MKAFYLVMLSFHVIAFCKAQNAGIGTTALTEKLHIDSGNVKIGNGIWNSNYKSLLKFGDASVPSIILPNLLP